MLINKQRLNQWLSGEIAAYNDGTTESIEMIQELCKYSKNESIPKGWVKLYANNKTGWYSYDGSGGLAHKPVSWFFEAEEAEKVVTIEQRIEALEKAVEEIRAFLVL